MKINKWLVLSILLLFAATALSSFFVGKAFSLKTSNEPKSKVVPISSEDIITISEAADYLKISEEKLKFLIDKSRAVDGKGIPYYSIDNKVLFSKNALSKWIVYIAENHLEY